MVFYIMRAPLNGVLMVRAPLNGVIYNAHLRGLEVRRAEGHRDARVAVVGLPDALELAVVLHVLQVGHLRREGSHHPEPHCKRAEAPYTTQES